MNKIKTVCLSALCIAISSMLLFTSLDFKINDLFSRLDSPLEENPKVVLVAIDDDAVNNIGKWPFSRDVYAHTAFALKSFGTEKTVFDLNFLDRSQVTLDPDFVNEILPDFYEDSFEPDPDSFMDLLGALNNPDKIFENAIGAVENIYLTATFDDEFEVTEKDAENSEKFLLKKCKLQSDKGTPEYTGYMPALGEFMKNAGGAGFVNADPDSDGYLRRVHLIVKHDGKYYGQLLFVPLLEKLGNPQVEISRRYITLNGAVLPDGEIRNIRIPRAEDGSIIAKYPKKQFIDYNVVSLWKILRLEKLEEAFMDNVATLDEYGYFDTLEEENPLDVYYSVMEIRNNLWNYETGSKDVTFEDYVAEHDFLMEILEECFAGNLEQSLLEIYEDDELLCDDIRNSFSEMSEAYQEICILTQELKELLEDSLVIIGTSATGTTDYSLTQYEEHYPSVGLHYTLTNQILSEDFTDDAPWYVSVLAAVLVCTLFLVLSYGIRRSSAPIYIGISIALLLTVSEILLYRFTKIYAGLAVPFCSLALVFILHISLRFVSESRGKRFITNAFSQCISPEVVKDIIKNPEKLKLGGSKKSMTAIFTDIEKFSTISELISPEQLIAFLNYYLTRMSNCIMEEKGTIDKYEGDAIVALVGAPLDMEDHAIRACAAAIRMKKAEREMNVELLKVSKGPRPSGMNQDLYDAFCILAKNKRKIFTRIGINSGDIIAGFVGSENKKNYTMIGNNVNLAARLEGANKQYSTMGILISESTKEMLGELFITRRLDKVQVMNIKTPVQLYELIDFKESASHSLIAYTDAWNKTMAIFESGNYQKALECFRKLKSMSRTDRVSDYYIMLLENFFTKGKYPSEADDIGVVYNYAEGELKGSFKLLQK